MLPPGTPPPEYRSNVTPAGTPPPGYRPPSPHTIEQRVTEVATETLARQPELYTGGPLKRAFRWIKSIPSKIRSFLIRIGLMRAPTVSSKQIEKRPSTDNITAFENGTVLAEAAFEGVEEAFEDEWIARSLQDQHKIGRSKLLDRLEQRRSVLVDYRSSLDTESWTNSRKECENRIDRIESLQEEVIAETKGMLLEREFDRPLDQMMRDEYGTGADIANSLSKMLDRLGMLERYPSCKQDVAYIKKQLAIVGENLDFSALATEYYEQSNQASSEEMKRLFSDQGNVLLGLIDRMPQSEWQQMKSTMTASDVYYSEYYQTQLQRFQLDEPLEVDIVDLTHFVRDEIQADLIRQTASIETAQVIDVEELHALISDLTIYGRIPAFEKSVLSCWERVNGAVKGKSLSMSESDDPEIDEGVAALSQYFGLQETKLKYYRFHKALSEGRSTIAKLEKQNEALRSRVEELEKSHLAVWEELGDLSQEAISKSDQLQQVREKFKSTVIELKSAQEALRELMRDPTRVSYAKFLEMGEELDAMMLQDEVDQALFDKLSSEYKKIAESEWLGTMVVLETKIQVLSPVVEELEGHLIDLELDTGMAEQEMAWRNEEVQEGVQPIQALLGVIQVSEARIEELRAICDTIESRSQAVHNELIESLSTLAPTLMLMEALSEWNSDEGPLEKHLKTYEPVGIMRELGKRTYLSCRSLEPQIKADIAQFQERIPV